MGLFDGIVNFFRPISTPLVSWTTTAAQRVIFPNASPVQVAAFQAKVQPVGEQLFAVGAVAGLAIGGAAAALAIAPAAGGLLASGGLAPKALNLLNNSGVDVSGSSSSDDTSFTDSTDFGDSDLTFSEDT